MKIIQKLSTYPLINTMKIPYMLALRLPDILGQVQFPTTTFTYNLKMIAMTPLLTLNTP